MKSALIISYYFPPTGGVWRPLKFVKYLPGNGWRPVVLTVEEKGCVNLDYGLFNQIPPIVKIYRTRTLITQKQTQAYGLHNKLTSSSEINIKNFNIKSKVLAFIRSFFLIPDTKVTWIPFAFLKTFRIFKQQHIEVIYATAPPYSSLLLGVFLKKLFTGKLILDFRDPWTQWFDVYRAWEHPLRKKIEYALEGFVIRNADKIIVTTESMKNYLDELYGNGNNPNKFVVIYNGFDSEDYSEIQAEKFDKFTVVYTGKIVTDLYSPQYFFEGLYQLLIKRPELSEDIQIIFLGTFPEQCKEMINKFNLNTIIQIKRHVKHKECLRYQKGANLLLLLLNEGVTNQLTISGKLFEYFYTCNPVFGVIPKNSAAASLIESVDGGQIVEPSDINSIQEKLYECYLAHKHNKHIHRVDKDRINQFDRKYLTRQLAETMDKLIAKKDFDRTAI